MDKDDLCLSCRDTFDKHKEKKFGWTNFRMVILQLEEKIKDLENKLKNK